MIELLIFRLFVILNTFSLDLYITSVISLKYLLLHLFFNFSWFYFMCDSNFLIILLQYLMLLFRMDLWGFADDFPFLECCELFDVQFYSFRNNILAQTSEIEMQVTFVSSELLLFSLPNFLPLRYSFGHTCGLID